MGHRAIYMAKEAGNRRFGYSHSSAIAIPGEVAWGPQTFMCHFHFVEQQHACAATLDEVFGEGGVAVDFDTQRMALFGGEEIALSAALQRACMGFTQQQWPGWHVEWAHRGVTDLAPLLGVDPQELGDYLEPFNTDKEFVDEYLFRRGNSALVTIVGSAGAPVNFQFGDLLDSTEFLLILGPDVIERIKTLPSVTPPREVHVSQGAIIDTRRGRVEYWFSLPERDRSEVIAKLWPGWDIVRQTEGYPRHLMESGQFQPDLLMSATEIFRDLKPAINVEADGPEQYLREIVAECEEDGDELQLHPLVAAALDAPLNAVERRAIFDEWVRSLATPMSDGL